MRQWPIFSLAVLFLLASCQRGEEIDLSRSRAAQSGLRVSSILSGEGEPGRTPIAASLAGIQAGVFLSQIAGSEIPPPLEEDIVGRPDALADIELLERFIALLRIDVREMLNREANREAAYDRYVTSLQSHASKAESRLRSLQNREEELQDDEQRLKRNVRELENDLETAIQAGEGRSTSALMTDVLNQQTRLAQVSTELAVVALLVNSYEDVIDPLNERLSAVTANEDALIKGVQVVDIPGVEGLGIIQVEDGIRNLRQRSRSSGFGGQTF